MPELPEYERRKAGRDHGDRDEQIAALTDIIATLAQDLRRIEDRVNRLGTTAGKASAAAPDATQHDDTAPAPWVWFNPPAAAEDQPESDGDPRVTVGNFVTWYNATFVGLEGSRSTAIPACWEQHTGLAMEVAALAYTWRAANLGSDAGIREAQYWLHQWRPGFIERLTREWVHADCCDGQHRDGGPPPRANRFAVAERHAAAVSYPGPGSDGGHGKPATVESPDRGGGVPG
ncbi:hypothetical protein [Amycolatopsis magusensis]|uniref:hypothetical protein n=1 Tax=Amycolatopsis magusensis TaxID=882444 RepID=UPI003796715F